LDKLFGGDAPFDTPKPVRLITRMLQVADAGDSDVVLDYFAGSATTAEGVIEYNAERLDVGAKYIMIQLPEKCADNPSAQKHGLPTIADIGKQRIRLVNQRFVNEKNGQLDLEDNRPHTSGFKVMKLDKSNFKQWLSVPEEIQQDDLEKQLEIHVDHIDFNASEEDILCELLLKAGFMPTERIEILTLADKQVFSIAEGVLLICLEEELTSELIYAVADREPMQFICLDKGFKGNDQLKANAVQTFKSRSQGAETEMVFKVV